MEEAESEMEEAEEAEAEVVSSGAAESAAGSRVRVLPRLLLSARRFRNKV